MKSREEIVARARCIIDEELERRLREAVRRLPHLCTHNYRHPLDPRKTVDGEPNEEYNRIRLTSKTIGLCMLGAESPENWGGTICEDPIDAQRCPYFNPAKDKAAVIKEFGEQLANIEWLKSNMPPLAELSWILSDLPRPSLLKRLWAFLFRFKTEAKIDDPLTLPPAS